MKQEDDTRKYRFAENEKEVRVLSVYTAFTRKSSSRIVNVMH